MNKDKLITVRVSHTAREAIKGIAKDKGVSLTDLMLAPFKKIIKNCTTKKGE